ncbi:DNA mismatch endonuclease Vsr [Sphingomonas sp. CGMCC 1.13654]|uniref:Very short patch repair endonuclease n=2 Tax=Sphingomonas chungangi TaxID=2683589 RepID=A0A838L8J3_9SPHN|nr:DNA mismatch endonuclease Vsr [Sphingomonas chungangi]MVW54110.1 DNA mismatch endonuclease Vsr [Sphingomonas chungangi]
MPSPDSNNEKSAEETRSRIMRAVRRANTRPEIVVRRLLHRMGLRFRLHRRGLPGTPDIVLPGRHTAIFVHGCFWHRHSGCRMASMPKTRIDFWQQKFDRNVERDRDNERALVDQGWRVLTVWECETRDLEALAERLRHLFHIERSKSADADSASSGGRCCET